MYIYAFNDKNYATYFFGRFTNTTCILRSITRVFCDIVIVDIRSNSRFIYSYISYVLLLLPSLFATTLLRRSIKCFSKKKDIIQIFTLGYYCNLIVLNKRCNFWKCEKYYCDFYELKESNLICLNNILQ